MLAEVLGERVLIIYFRLFLQCIPRGLVVTIRTGASNIPSLILGGTFFSSLLFLSFCFRFVFFLVIAVLFCFFRSINFLLYCLIEPFPRSPSRGHAIYVFLVLYIFFHPRPHRLHIDCTSTAHRPFSRPHIDPTLNCFF